MPARTYIVEDPNTPAPTWAGLRLPFPPPAPNGSRGAILLPGGKDGLDEVRMTGINAGSTSGIAGGFTLSITGCQALVAMRCEQESKYIGSWTRYFFTHQLAGYIDMKLFNRFYKEMTGYGSDTGTNWLAMRKVWLVLATNYEGDAGDMFNTFKSMGIPYSQMTHYVARPGDGSNFNFSFRVHSGQFGEF